mgnify:CR=1 FL=1
MTRKKRRLYLLGLSLGGLGVAASLALFAFQDNLLFFYSPSDLQAKALAPEQRVRLGGLVAEESFERLPDGVSVGFVVTDLVNTVPVVFAGILPDLFREGQGVVAEGRLRADGVFEASDVLAKHDETYMPREVADALKASGEWRGGEAGQ